MIFEKLVDQLKVFFFFSVEFYFIFFDLSSLYF